MAKDEGSHLVPLSLAMQKADAKVSVVRGQTLRVHTNAQNLIRN